MFSAVVLRLAERARPERARPERARPAAAVRTGAGAAGGARGALLVPVTLAAADHLARDASPGVRIELCHRAD
jgi:hypothetical protein